MNFSYNLVLTESELKLLKQIFASEMPIAARVARDVANLADKIAIAQPMPADYKTEP